MGHFRFHPNFYIILVAPPGIVSKSTTAGIGMQLLRQVPDIRFGPDVVTWQALIQSFAESAMTFEIAGEYYPMSALTIQASEFGNLLDPRDTAMVDLLVNLWDGNPGAFTKKTKSSGNDEVINPWINLIACTTPSWIAGNFPEYMIGGGFTSRCLFVYAEKKARYVAYPGMETKTNLGDMGRRLMSDLTEISQIVGEYRLSPDAVEWGKHWYKAHYETKSANLDMDRFGGYIARKQTHVHKLAMILAAAESDTRVITRDTLALAVKMVTDLEPDMQLVFSKIGKTEDSVYIDRLIEYVVKRKSCPWADAYRFVHAHFPKIQDFEAMITGAIRAEYLELKQEGGGMILRPGRALSLPKEE